MKKFLSLWAVALIVTTLGSSYIYSVVDSNLVRTEEPSSYVSPEVIGQQPIDPVDGITEPFDVHAAQGWRLYQPTYSPFNSLYDSDGTIDVRGDRTLAIRSVDDYPAIWRTAGISEVVDSWHMGSRECTSWVAWRVWQAQRYSVYNWGDAKKWVAKAEKRNVKTDSTPAVGSAAYLDNGTDSGHIMYVQNLNADGTIHVTDYNGYGGAGNFGEANIQPEGLVFIHFENVAIGG